ncbi:hypothetical protein SCG7086_BP_00010, partial [Chlamydiales bacterium SCGC AG-110-P3]
ALAPAVSDLIRGLMELQAGSQIAETAETYNAERIYRYVYKSLNKMGAKDAESRSNSAHRTPQRSGVCSYAVLMAILKDDLPPKDYKRLKIELRLQGLMDFSSGLSPDKRPSDRDFLVLEQGVSKLARSTVKAFNKELISPEEAKKLEVLLSREWEKVKGWKTLPKEVVETQGWSAIQDSSVGRIKRISRDQFGEAPSDLSTADGGEIQGYGFRAVAQKTVFSPKTDINGLLLSGSSLDMPFQYENTFDVFCRTMREIPLPTVNSFSDPWRGLTPQETEMPIEYFNIIADELKVRFREESGPLARKEAAVHALSLYVISMRLILVQHPEIAKIPLLTKPIQKLLDEPYFATQDPELDQRWLQLQEYCAVHLSGSNVGNPESPYLTAFDDPARMDSRNSEINKHEPKKVSTKALFKYKFSKPPGEPTKIDDNSVDLLPEIMLLKNMNAYEGMKDVISGEYDKRLSKHENEVKKYEEVLFPEWKVLFPKWEEDKRKLEELKKTATNEFNEKKTEYEKLKKSEEYEKKLQEYEKAMETAQSELDTHSLALDNHISQKPLLPEKEEFIKVSKNVRIATEILVPSKGYTLDFPESYKLLEDISKGMVTFAGGYDVKDPSAVVKDAGVTITSNNSVRTGAGYDLDASKAFGAQFGACINEPRTAQNKLAVSKMLASPQDAVVDHATEQRIRMLRSEKKMQVTNTLEFIRGNSDLIAYYSEGNDGKPTNKMREYLLFLMFEPGPFQERLLANPEILADIQDMCTAEVEESLKSPGGLEKGCAAAGFYLDLWGTALGYASNMQERGTIPPPPDGINIDKEWGAWHAVVQGAIEGSSKEPTYCSLFHKQVVAYSRFIPTSADGAEEHIQERMASYLKSQIFLSSNDSLRPYLGENLVEPMRLAVDRVGEVFHALQQTDVFSESMLNIVEKATGYRDWTVHDWPLVERTNQNKQKITTDVLTGKTYVDGNVAKSLPAKVLNDSRYQRLFGSIPMVGQRVGNFYYGEFKGKRYLLTLEQSDELEDICELRGDGDSKTVWKFSENRLKGDTCGFEVGCNYWISKDATDVYSSETQEPIARITNSKVMKLNDKGEVTESELRTPPSGYTIDGEDRVRLWQGSGQTELEYPYLGISFVSNDSEDSAVWKENPSYRLKTNHNLDLLRNFSQFHLVETAQGKQQAIIPISKFEKPTTKGDLLELDFQKIPASGYMVVNVVNGQLDPKEDRTAALYLAYLALGRRDYESAKLFLDKVSTDTVFSGEDAKLVTEMLKAIPELTGITNPALYQLQLKAASLQLSASRRPVTRSEAEELATIVLPKAEVTKILKKYWSVLTNVDERYALTPEQELALIEALGISDGKLTRRQTKIKKALFDIERRKIKLNSLSFFSREMDRLLEAIMISSNDIAEKLFKDGAADKNTDSLHNMFTSYFAEVSEEELWAMVTKEMAKGTLLPGAEADFAMVFGLDYFRFLGGFKIDDTACQIRCCQLTADINDAIDQRSQQTNRETSRKVSYKKRVNPHPNPVVKQGIKPTKISRQRTGARVNVRIDYLPVKTDKFWSEKDSFIENYRYLADYLKATSSSSELSSITGKIELNNDLPLLYKMARSTDKEERAQLLRILVTMDPSLGENRKCREFLVITMKLGREAPEVGGDFNISTWADVVESKFPKKLRAESTSKCPEFSLIDETSTDRTRFQKIVASFKKYREGRRLAPLPLNVLVQKSSAESVGKAEKKEYIPPILLIDQLSLGTGVTRGTQPLKDLFSKQHRLSATSTVSKTTAADENLELATGQKTGSDKDRSLASMASALLSDSEKEYMGDYVTSRFGELNDDIKAGAEQNKQRDDYLQAEVASVQQAKRLCDENKESPFERRLAETAAFEKIMLEPKKTAILALANQRSVDEQTAIQQGLLKSGAKVQDLTMEQLTKLFIQKDLEEISRLTSLPNEGVNTLFNELAQFYVASSRVSQMEKGLAGLQEATADDPTSIKDALSLLHAKREYDVKDYPALLVFEHMTGFLLREKQVDIILSFVNEADPDTGKLEELVHQLIMGGGKSKVLLPLLALMRARGDNLSILMVPKAMYETNVEDLRKSNKEFGQPLRTFKFTRNTDTSPNTLINLKQDLENWQMNREFIVITDETAHCLDLKYIELVDQEAKGGLDDEELKELRESIDALKEIRRFIRTKGDVLIDEVHAVASCRREVNYTVGDPEPPSLSDWLAISSLFQVLDECSFTDIQGEERKLGEFLRDGTQSKQMASTTSINAVLQDAAKKLVDRPIRVVKEGAERQFKIPVDKQEEVEKFILGGSSSYLDELNEMDPEVVNIISLFKQEVTELLNTTLKRTANENFARSKSLDMASYRIPLPCAAAGAVIDSAEFSSHFETMNYIHQFYRTASIEELEVQEFLEIQWRRAEEEWKALSATTDINSVPAALTFKKVFGVKISDFDPSTDRGVKGFSEVLNRQKGESEVALQMFLDDMVFPQLKVHPEQLRGTARNLLSLFRSVQAFTGTPHNHRSYHHRLKVHLDKGTDGQTIDHLQRKNTPVHVSEAADPKVLFEEVLRPGNKLRTEAGEFSAFIDVGAMFADKGINNRQVALGIREFYSESGDIAPSKKYFLYFDDDQNKLCYITKDSDKPQFDLEGLPKDRSQVFAYYDQQHCTGVDIPQPPNGRALTSVSEKTVQSDLLQGVMRMRGLSKDQNIEMVISGAMAISALQQADEAAISVDHVLAYSTLSQLRNEIDETVQATIQGFANEVRQWALANLDKSRAAKRSKNFRKVRPFLVDKMASDLYAQYAGAVGIQDTKEYLTKQKNKILERAKEVGFDTKGLDAELSKILTDAIGKAPSKTKARLSGASEGVVFTEKQTQKKTQQQIKQQVTMQTARARDGFELNKMGKAEDPWVHSLKTSNTLGLINKNSLSISEALAKVDMDDRVSGSFHDIRITGNFLNTTTQGSSLLDAYQKPLFQYLVYDPGGGEPLKALFVTVSEGKAFTQKLKRERAESKEATPPYLYLYSPTGMLVQPGAAGRVPSAKMDELKRLQQQALMFDGQLRQLLKGDSDEESWIKTRGKDFVPVFFEKLGPILSPSDKLIKPFFCRQMVQAAA